jgi:glycine/D-amino acid oxidase-like deaminating enzyme
LDVCLTQEFADFNAQSFREYQEAGGDVSHVKFYEGDEAKKRTRIPQTVTAYEWPAGSSHPAKLAQWLLSQSIAKGARLFTHCPATSVTKSSASAAEQTLWDISTPRGTVTASTVIHCTNAFAAHLLPQLSSFVTPNRVQAHAIVPPASLSGLNTMSSTLSLRHTLKHFYSVAQRRPDGVIILGAALRNPNLSQATFEGRLTPDDSAFSEEIRDDAMKNFEACFPDCATEKLRHGEGLWHTWSGIIGLTTDSVPFVGRVDGAPGQWVCAGFNGHGKQNRLLSDYITSCTDLTETDTLIIYLGMARIFTCAPGLAKLVLGGSWSDTGLPECFELTQTRLKKLQNGVSDSVF